VYFGCIAMACGLFRAHPVFPATEDAPEHATFDAQDVAATPAMARAAQFT
jgi:hypothetical protein